MSNEMTNGQGSENESPTEGKTATPSVESSKVETLPSEAKKDVKEDKKVPYDRFSDVVATKNKALAALEKREAEYQALKAQLDATITQKEAPTKSEINNLTKQIPDKLKDKVTRLFGDDNMEEGYSLLQESLQDLLEEALTAKERKNAEESLAKVEQDKARLEYVSKETERIVKEYEIKDINKFHKFIEDFVKEKGGKFVKNEDENLDFDYYAIRHERELLKASSTKKVDNFQKVSTKTVSKTEAEPSWTTAQLRNW
jgi:hypothetical protein